MDNLIKRKPEILLPLSLRFAKEYFDALCKMQTTYTLDEIQESKELTMVQRALWTALIIEIGRLFDTYSQEDKKVISFKKLPHLKDEITRLHGDAIIGKIIETRKTFTGHFAQKENRIISVSEICNSKLGEILNKMSSLLVTEKSTEERRNDIIKK